MGSKLLLMAAVTTAGFLMPADDADARVRVYAGPNRTFVGVGGPRYRAYGYGGYGYGGYYAPSYGYSYPAYSYGYAYPSYGYNYGYAYPAYGYGYRGGYYGGRTFVAGPNRYYYRGPYVRVGGRW